MYALGFSQAIFHVLTSHSLSTLIEAALYIIRTPELPFSLQNVAIIFWGIAWSVLALSTTFLALLGVFSLFSRKKQACLWLLLPLGFVLCAAILQKFPLAQRVLLFLIPGVILCVAEGISSLRSSQRRQPLSLLWCGTAIGLLLYPLLAGGYQLIHPRTDQELRPVIQYVEEHREQEDELYIYYGASGVFRYYAERFGLSDEQYITGIASRENPQQYFQDLDQLRGQARVWLVFSHVFGPEKVYFLQYLDSIGGKRLDSVEGIRASAYLYDVRTETLR